MRIAGIQKNSMVDFPEKLAAVVFTQGCNMNCGYCHNSRLISSRSHTDMLNEEEVFVFLNKRQGLLDGVVITGGEPTLQHDLGDFLLRVKNMGYQVKLDTNGTNPLMLEKLIDSQLLDYVAMDIKAPLPRYREICCSNINIEDVKKSVEILMDDKVEYEFRTTYAPGLEENDLLEIAGFITGARRYVLQQYREIDNNTGEYSGRKQTRDILNDIFNTLGNKVRYLQLRGDFALL